jgi:hypothetical protein
MRTWCLFSRWSCPSKSVERPSIWWFSVELEESCSWWLTCDSFHPVSFGAWAFSQKFPMRYSYNPKSFTWIRGANRGIDWGEVRVHAPPKSQTITLRSSSTNQRNRHRRSPVPPPFRRRKVSRELCKEVSKPLVALVCILMLHIARVCSSELCRRGVPPC